MEKDTVKTVVVFRKFKDGGDILALFPRVLENDGFVSSYQSIGQHSAADYGGCMKATVAASPEEYISLKRELEGLGYNLEVKKRNRVSKVRSLEQSTPEVNSGMPQL